MGFNEFIDTIAGPLHNPQWCIYFQIAAILMLVAIILYVSSEFYFLFNSKKPFKLLYSFGILFTGAMYLLMYYLYRLMYGICLNSVK